MMRRGLVGAAAVAALLVVGGAGGASADRLITGSQVKDGTITSADIKDRTLKQRDFSAATSARLRGAVGPAGPGGRPAMSDVVVRNQTLPVGAVSVKGEVFCEDTERPVGLGFHGSASGGGRSAVVSRVPIDASGAPIHDGQVPSGGGWSVEITNLHDVGTVTGYISVLCATS